MKKLSLYMMLAFAGLFTIACGPEDNEFASLKVADAESPVTIPGISAVQVGIIDLNKVVISDKMDVEAFTVPETALPDGVELSKAEIKFEDGTILPATADGKVSGLALSAYIASIYGLRPEVRSVDGNVYLYATQNGAAVKVDADEINFQVVPKAPEIATTYYLTGSMNDWDNTNTDYELGNNGEDPYANPTFICMIDLSKLDSPTTIEFKATPIDGLGGDWSHCLAAGEEGKFNYNNEGGNFKIEGISPEAKFIRLTFNMLEQTWNYVEIAYNEYIWQAGNSNGWGNPAAPLYGADNDGKYVGFMYLNGEFKFRSHEDSWDAPDWGAGSSEGSLAEQGSNLSAEAGYYQVNADLAAMTYSLTQITTIGIIGPAQGGGWDTDTDMEYNEETGAWEATIDLNADEMKFRANDGWDINWGGTEEALTQGGPNIKIAEAGTYFIQLFAYCDGKAYFNITKK